MVLELDRYVPNTIYHKNKYQAYEKVNFYIFNTPYVRSYGGLILGNHLLEEAKEKVAKKFLWNDG